MSAYVQMIRSVSGKYNDRINRATSDIFHCLNLNYFWYNKITDDGLVSTLTSHLPFEEYFGFQEMYTKYPLFRHPSLIQPGVRFLKDIEYEPLQEILSASRDKYNLRLLFSIINKTKDGIEEFGFASPSSNGSQVCLLFNEVPLLRLFSEYFKEENRMLFSELNKNQISMLDLIGSTFYEKDPPIIAQLTKKRNFLRKMGIHDDNALSLAEIDVVKLILQGHSASQIGARLLLSKRTIEHRIEKIKDKLSCYSKSELVKKARELEQLGILK